MKKELRIKVWNKYDKRCAYCGRILVLEKKKSNTMQIDHIKAVDRDLRTGKMLKPENDIIENMNPSCKYCNGDKHSLPLETWRGVLINRYRQMNYLFRSKAKMELAINHGVIEIGKWDGKFYFENHKQEVSK